MENTFTPYPFWYKRILNFWRNEEEKKDPDYVSGHFNEELYQRIREAHGLEKLS